MTQQEKMVIGVIVVLVLLMLGLYFWTRPGTDSTAPLGSTSTPSVLGTSTAPTLNGTSTIQLEDFEQKG